MTTNNKIMACVDQSHFADYVADYAAWSARRMDAPLEFLHVIDRHPEISTGKDHSGAIGIGAQETLLTEYPTKTSRAASWHVSRGRIFLNRLSEHAKAGGYPFA